MPRSTSVVSTVPGTVASIQASVLKPAREITEPSTPTPGASSIFHPPSNAHSPEPRGASLGAFVAMGRGVVVDGAVEDWGSVAGSCGTRKPSCPLIWMGHVFEAASNCIRSKFLLRANSARTSSGVRARRKKDKTAILAGEGSAYVQGIATGGRCNAGAAGYK